MDKQQSRQFNSAVPLYYQIKELLKAEISTNSLKADQIIPSEIELSEKHDVSVGTIKRAINELVSEGILYRKQGKGTFVGRPNFDRSFIRFFRFATDENGEHIVPTCRVFTSAITYPTDEVKKTLKLSNDEKVIKIKRLRIVKNIPLVYEDLYFPQKLFPSFKKIDITEKLLYPIFEKKYNIPVIWADEFLEPRIATAEEANYLNIKEGDAVIYIERIAYTYGDKPIEFRTSLGRGDRFRYHIEIR